MKYKFSQSNFNDPNYRDFSKSLLTTNDLSNKAKIANVILTSKMKKELMKISRVISQDCKK